MVAGHRFLAKPFGQSMRHPLGEPPGVHEDQCRAVALDMRGQPLVDLRPLLGRTDGRQFAGRHIEREVEFADVAGVHDPARRTTRPHAAEETRDPLHRSLRRREANAHGRLGTEVVEPLERHRQMRAPFVTGQGMDLVDDHRPHPPQPLPRLFRGNQQEERLGRRHKNVRRPPQHLLTLGGGRVARPYRSADRGTPQPGRLRPFRDLLQRPFQIAADVVAERLERRHVHDLDSLFEPPFQPLAEEPIKAHQESGQRFARARRRGDQGRRAGGNRGPAEPLGRGGFAKPLAKPIADHGMEQRFIHAGILAAELNRVSSVGARVVRSDAGIAQPAQALQRDFPA